MCVVCLWLYGMNTPLLIKRTQVQCLTDVSVASLSNELYFPHIAPVQPAVLMGLGISWRNTCLTGHVLLKWFRSMYDYTDAHTVIYNPPMGHSLTLSHEDLRTPTWSAYNY